MPNHEYDRLEKSLERRGFVRAKAWAIANGFHPARIRNICVSRLRCGRDWNRGRERGGGGGEIWVKKTAIESCGILNSETGPWTDETGMRWWALDDVHEEFQISIATVRAIHFKRRKHIALSGSGILEMQLVPRGLRSGGVRLMHFREDQLLELRDHFQQPDYREENGEKLVRTRGLLQATKLTRSCIKEKAGKRIRYELLPYNGKLARFHRLSDAKEAEQRLQCPPGFMTAHGIIKSDRWPHVTERLLAAFIKHGHKSINEGPKTQKPLVNGHQRHVFDIGQLDRIEAYEKLRHENVLDKDGRIWDRIGEGSYMDPDKQTWCDYHQAWKQFGVGRKLLDPLYNESRDELGRAVCTELLTVPIRRRDSSLTPQPVRVFWINDIKRIKDCQEHQKRLLRLGVYRDSDGSIFATGTRLGLTAATSSRQRRQGKLTGFEHDLFGKPVWFYRVDSKETRRRFRRFSELPVRPDNSRAVAALPPSASSQHSAAGPLGIPTSIAISTKPKRAPGRTVETQNAEIQKFSFDEINRGCTLKAVANSVLRAYGKAMTEPNIYEYAKRYAKRTGLKLISARQQKAILKKALKQQA